MDELHIKIANKWAEKAQRYVSRGDSINAQRCIAVMNLIKTQPHDVVISFINNELSKVDYADKRYSHKPLKILEEALTDAYKLQQNEGKSIFYKIISTGRAVPVSDTRKQRYTRNKR